MITYVQAKGDSLLQCKVRLDNKIVGGIYATPDGDFYYRPGGGRLTGEIFGTIAEVKQSLEED